MTRHRARRPSARHRRAALGASPTLSARAYVMPKCKSDRGDVAPLDLACPLRMDPLVLVEPMRPLLWTNGSGGSGAPARLSLRAVAVAQRREFALRLACRRLGLVAV